MRAYDGAHPHGKAGLRMYKAAAEFDNVVLTPGPLMRQSTLGPATESGTWTSAPEGWPGGVRCRLARGRRARDIWHAGGGLGSHRDVEG